MADFFSGDERDTRDRKNIYRFPSLLIFFPILFIVSIQLEMSCYWLFLFVIIRLNSCVPVFPEV